MHVTQARTQNFEKGGANFRNFTKGGGVNLKKIPVSRLKIRGVNTVSGEKLHDFEIICPARVVQSYPPHSLCILDCNPWKYQLEIYEIMKAAVTTVILQ